MTRVAVNGEVVRWARERSGASLHDLAKRFPKISEWDLVQQYHEAQRALGTRYRKVT